MKRRYDTSNRPVTWKTHQADWIEKEQGRHSCRCGCGEKIVVRGEHYFKGVPLYKRGHHPSSGMAGRFRNTVESFWSKVDKGDGCWIWTGMVTASGYGRLYYQGRLYGAHRLAYQLSRGFPASGLVCHTCDNPRCVRPDHLFDGSQMDNMGDAACKGRTRSKYGKDAALKVVELVRSGMSAAAAGRQVGMTAILAQKIMGGEVWSHATGIPKKVRIRKRGK